MVQRRVQHQRTSVTGQVPDPSDVMVGEIIINLADRTLRTKNGSNAIIRVNQNILVSGSEPTDPISGDLYLTTSGQIRAYYNPGAGLTWYDIAAPEDLSGYLQKAGGTMTGQITLPNGATGSEAVSATDASALISTALTPYLAKAGGTMSGQITLPGGATGSEAVSVTQMDAAIAAAVPPDLSLVVLKSGSTMTGQLTLPGGGTANQAVSANELASAISTHAGQPDPHTVYALSTELDSAVSTINTDKANLASPTFTGTPAAPTATAYTDTTQLATTANVVATVKLVPENAQTGTSYTLVIGDAGKMVTLSNGSAITMTVPPNASVAFPLNTRIDIAQWGAGQVTVAQGAGVTIRSSGAKLKLTGQYSGATLWKKATDEWVLIGDIAT